MFSLLESRYVNVHLDVQDLIEGRLDPWEAATLTRLRVEALRRLGREYGPGMLQEKKIRYCIKDKIGMVLSPDGDLHDFTVLDGVHDEEVLGSFLARSAGRFPLAADQEGGSRQVSLSYGAGFTPRNGERLLYHLSRHLSPVEAAKGRVQALGGERPMTPFEDWIVLSAEEQDRLVPRGSRKLGSEWEIEAGVARRLLTYLRPPSHNHQVSEEDVLEGTLRARVVGLQGTRLRVDLSGRVRVRHPDNLPTIDTSVHHDPALGASGWAAVARVLGFLDASLDRDGKASLEDFGLITEGGRWLTPDPAIQLEYGSFIRLARPPHWGPLFAGKEVRRGGAPSIEPRP